MVGRSAAIVALAASLLGAGATAHPAAAHPRLRATHPLHTSLAELAYDPAARAINVSLRVFVDDFAAAVAHGTAARGGAVVVPPDSALFRYVDARFALVDRAGRRVPLRWCGARRAAELLFLCLRAPAAAPPTGLRVRNALLTEVFTDQVNIVQASFGGRRQTLLFTPGDPAKALR